MPTFPLPPGSPLSTFDPSCLYSVVKNVSGVTKIFSFLPPHGTTLAADEEYSVFGNILEAVVRGQRWSGRRNQQSLQNSLCNDPPTLQILRTPNVILEDVHNAETKMLIMDRGALAVADPCWDNSLSTSDYPTP